MITHKYNDLVRIPPELPDEIFSSIINRAYCYSGEMNVDKFSIKTVGTKHFNPKRVRSLELFDSSEDLIEHTLLPFYSITVNRDKYEGLLRQALEGDVSKVYGFFNYSDLNEGLKVCPECVESDISDYGVPYYKTYHQIPGITACVKHGSRLSKSHTPRYHLLRCEGEKEEANESEIRLARLALDLKGVTRDEIIDYIEQELKSRNFINAKGEIQRKRIVESLTGFYSKRFLESLGIREDRDQKWLYFILKENRVVPPVYYYLLIDYLSNTDKVPEEKIEVSTLSEISKCKNPLCRSQSLEYFTYGKSKVAWCRDCDMVFSRGKIYQYGRAYTKKIKDLLDQKIPAGRIEREYELYKGQVGDILRKDPEALRVKILNSREKALRYESKVKLKSSDYRTYELLMTFDKIWLDDNLRPPSKNRSREETVWLKRERQDREYYKRLIEIKEKLLSEDRRLSKSYIYSSIGITAFNHDEIRWPRTHKLVMSLVETREEALLRRGRLYLEEHPYASRREFLLKFGEHEIHKRVYEKILEETY